MPRRVCTGEVDAVVGVSQYTLDRHLDWGYFRDTPLRTVIYNAYDPPECDRASPEKPHDALRLGFLGGLTRRKGFGFMLKTLATAEQTWELYIGGRTDSDYVRDLRVRYEGPHIHFLGYVDPADFFKTIDVLLVPSLWPEPFGRIVVEAYAHGVPVIASNRGGLREIVEDGETGFTFDPNQPSEMIERIRDLDVNRSFLQRMQQAAIQEAKRYRVDCHIQAYLEVYERVDSTESHLLKA
jgi:glycosyltransferase involved in cell wall biosynthesis